VGDGEATSWLLEGDPAIRWQALRDLTDALPEAVAAEHARVAREGWAAQLLAAQGRGGFWGNPALVEGWHGSAARQTLLTLGALRDMGLDPLSDEARDAMRRLRESSDWFKTMPDWLAWAGRSFFEGETEPCINGRVVSAGAYFRQDVQVVVDRLLTEQMADGGWNCEQENGSVRGSFNSTINVLEGLLEYERATGGSLQVAEARRRGEEYLVARGLLRRLSTGEVIDDGFARLAYPLGYRFDILRGLDYFRDAGASPDPRMSEALAIVASRRGSDGRWLMEASYPEEAAMDFGERQGEPSRWVTLMAMRVERWASSSSGRGSRV
jgi:hypothetical protein